MGLVGSWWGGGVKILLFCGDKSFFVFFCYLCVCVCVCVCVSFSKFFLGLTSKTDYLGQPESSVFFYTQGIIGFIK